MARSVLGFLLVGSVMTACALDRSGLLDEGAGGSMGTGAGPSTGGMATTTTRGGGGAFTTVSSTGGGPPMAEDCLNGSDDDGDGAVDCDDSDCSAAGFSCVPELVGATAYLSDATGAGACPPGVTEVDLSTCGDCECSKEVGTCDVDITIYDDAQCTNDLATFSANDGDCTTLPNPAASRWFKHDNPTPNDDASCEPVDDTISVVTGKACETPVVGTCPSKPGNVCVPTPKDDARTCVEVPAAMGCGGDYPEVVAAYQGGVTECTCSCEAGSQGCGPIHVNVNSSNACRAPTKVALTNPCTAAGVISAWAVEPQPGTITCTPTTMPEPAAPGRRLCCASANAP